MTTLIKKIKQRSTTYLHEKCVTFLLKNYTWNEERKKAFHTNIWRSHR